MDKLNILIALMASKIAKDARENGFHGIAVTVSGLAVCLTDEDITLCLMIEVFRLSFDIKEDVICRDKEKSKYHDSIRELGELAANLGRPELESLIMLLNALLVLDEDKIASVVISLTSQIKTNDKKSQENIFSKN